MAEHVAYVVVGAGAMGLATTWQLARRGHRVIALERFERGHARGASHGATRNFNNAYEAPHYLDLLVQARAEWDELSRTTGEPLLRLHGLAKKGEDLGVTRLRGPLFTREESRGVLGKRNPPRRWSGMRFGGDVLFTPDAGVVRAQAALEALERGARARGADVRFGHRVLRLDESAGGVTVEIEAGGDRYELVADRVVVTSGAWTPGILPPSFPLPRLTVTEESPAHFAPVPGDPTWPSFNHRLSRRQYPGPVYGMPTPGEGVKVGFHLVGPVVDPDARTFQPVPALAARLRDYVAEWLPGLDPDSAVPISCTYTSTDTQDFVLDRRGRIVVGAGFSGHGFKFTPAVGAVLADLATDDAARAAEPFRLA